jgi:hypothetical protein
MKVVVHPQQQPMGPDGASQFVPPVHAVKVSTNGIVYVADRGGRRVPIFTIAGKFVNQVLIVDSSRKRRWSNAEKCGSVHSRKHRTIPSFLAAKLALLRMSEEIQNMPD